MQDMEDTCIEHLAEQLGASQTFWKARGGDETSACSGWLQLVRCDLCNRSLDYATFMFESCKMHVREGLLYTTLQKVQYQRIRI